MIYISSSCVKSNRIANSVQKLVDNGFRNIELSGGTEFYDGVDHDLLELKEKYNINYLCHNYFPPPKQHFVLNLASLNDDIYERTFQHLVHSIELSKRFGAKKFGFHAGFFIDIKVNEIGKKISKDSLYDRKQAIQRFCNGYLELHRIAGDLELYIENNVFSATNYKTYGGEQIFMLCDVHDYSELRKMISFNLLLDIAHLKVSSKTLGLDFEDVLPTLIKCSDYIHVSDNDSLHDLNKGLEKDADLIRLLKREELASKTFTLEVYDDMKKIKESYRILEGLIDD